MSTESEPEVEIEDSGDSTPDLGGILDGYKLHTDRMDVLARRWLEAIQVVAEDEDRMVLDSLRHRLQMTLDDTSHEKMLRIVSIAIAAQVETTETGEEN